MALSLLSSIIQFHQPQNSRKRLLTLTQVARVQVARNCSSPRDIDADRIAEGQTLNGQSKPLFNYKSTEVSYSFATTTIKWAAVIVLLLELICQVLDDILITFAVRKLHILKARKIRNRRGSS
jgi:hypothetical protein